MIKSKYLYNILMGQYSTEKSVMLAEKHKSITFKVTKSSNKYDIKYAVEKLFNVLVSSVRIINVKGKKIRFKNKIGKKSDWKKAIVILKKGYDINFSEFK